MPDEVCEEDWEGDWAEEWDAYWYSQDEGELFEYETGGWDVPRTREEDERTERTEREGGDA